MKKIVTYGVEINENFGGPSLLHGFSQLMEEVFDDFSIINIQSKKIINESNNEFPFDTLIFSASPNKLFVKAILYKLGIKPKDAATREVLLAIKEADFVVNLFGICFCDNANPKKSNRLKIVKNTAGRFLLSVIARMYGVQTIKNTASYGPMKLKESYIGANVAVNKIFNKVIAREEKSYLEVSKYAKNNNIFLSPDTANMMKFEVKHDEEKKRKVGISISHQIIKQWGKEKKYIEGICALSTHVKKTFNLDIILIPNEVPTGQFNDNDVAEEIKLRLKSKNVEVEVLDLTDVSSLEMKNEIANCEAIIAARYHTCVAALSAGIPVIATGWHNKYLELMALYGQEKWVISKEEFSEEYIIKLFDYFYSQNEKIKEVLQDRKVEVTKKIIDVALEVFK